MCVCVCFWCHLWHFKKKVSLSKRKSQRMLWSKWSPDFGGLCSIPWKCFFYVSLLLLLFFFHRCLVHSFAIYHQSFNDHANNVFIKQIAHIFPAVIFRRRKIIKSISLIFHSLSLSQSVRNEQLINTLIGDHYNKEEVEKKMKQIGSSNMFPVCCTAAHTLTRE